MNYTDWAALTPDQKNTELFNQQVEMLNHLLERNAITQNQYDASMAMLKNGATER